MEKICGIYCISNSKYFYIGQSVDIYRRWNKHRWELKNNKHKNQIMQNVYNLYIETDPFEYAIVKETIPEELSKAEKELAIRIHKKNKLCGGFQWQSYEEWLENPKGKIQYKHNIINTVKQYNLQGELLNEWDSPKIASKETNTNYSALVSCLNGKNKTAGGFLWSYTYKVNTNIAPNRSKCRKTVRQLTLDRTFIKEWSSIQEASENLNINLGSIKNCIKGTQKQAGGYLWER